MAVDLGGTRDYIAIAIIERILEQHVDEGGLQPHQVENPKYYSSYKLRYLERVPMGTRAPALVEKVKVMLEHPSLVDQCKLIIDATANVAVRQMMEDAKLHPIGIWSTTGRNWSRSIHGFNVPKTHLVSTLNAVYQSRRISVPYDLPFRKEYEKELEHFEPKQTASGAMTYEAAQESVHDDLVMAVSMILWYCEKVHGKIYRPNKGGSRVTEMKDPLRSGQ